MRQRMDGSRPGLRARWRPTANAQDAKLTQCSDRHRPPRMLPMLLRGPVVAFSNLTRAVRQRCLATARRDSRHELCLHHTIVTTEQARSRALHAEHDCAPSLFRDAASTTAGRPNCSDTVRGYVLSSLRGQRV